MIPFSLQRQRKCGNAPVVSYKHSIFMNLNLNFMSSNFRESCSSMGLEFQEPCIKKTMIKNRPDLTWFGRFLIIVASVLTILAAAVFTILLPATGKLAFCRTYLVLYCRYGFCFCRINTISEPAAVLVGEIAATGNDTNGDQTADESSSALS